MGGCQKEEGYSDMKSQRWITLGGRHILIHSKMPDDIESSLYDDNIPVYGGSSGEQEDEYEEEMKHDAELERQRQAQQKAEENEKNAKSINIKDLQKLYQLLLQGRIDEGRNVASAMATLQNALLSNKLTDKEKQKIQNWLNDLSDY